jgi:hypothetical protein
VTSHADRAPTDRTEVVSQHTIAELAGAGFSILRQPSMRVEYEVHHVQDRPGYLQDVLRGKYSRLFGALDDETPRFIETLTTAAHGIGLVIGTRMVGGGPDVRGHRIEGEHPDIVRVDDPEKESRAFRATAVPNVNFVYDPARVFEGLISVEVEPMTLQLRQGRAIREVMREIAQVAGLAKAPVMSMQSPVQLPLHDFGQDDESKAPRLTWPRSAVLAVRFAIGLPQTNARLRLQIADDLIRFCREHGFGLWLADSRSGYRAGSWFSVCQHDKTLVRRRFDGALDPRGASRAYASLPVTFVGPARLDSVRAILDFLTYFPELGILACSMAIIDDIAFVHLQLTINAVSNARLDWLNEVLHDTTLASPKDTPTLLPAILSHLLVGEEYEVNPEVRLRLAHRAGDYHMLVGPALPVRRDSDPRGALWVSWEVEGDNAELSAPFLALHGALSDLKLFHEGSNAANANVEYLICRRVRNSVLRGKGKLSFPTYIAQRNFGYPDLHAGLSALSQSIENSWRLRLHETHDVRELTVSWREYWLGHWAAPLD